MLRCPACKMVFRETPGWELPEEFTDRGMGAAPAYIFGGMGVVAVLLLVILTHMLVIMRREIAARKSRPPQPIAAKPLPKVPPHLLNAKGAWAPPEAPTTTPAKPTPTEPVTSSPIPEVIILHAKNAETHGSKITYEVGGKKDNIGNWVDAAAWVRWDVKFVAPGMYDVEVQFGCEPNSAGSSYRVVVGEQEVTGKIISTGSWDEYERQSLGEIRIERTGKTSLEVRPIEKKGMAVMNLRSITLRPVGVAAVEAGDPTPTGPPLPHMKVPTMRWRDKNPAMTPDGQGVFLLDARNAFSIPKGWSEGDAGSLMAGEEARTTSVQWKVKFRKPTTVRVEVTYRPAEEGRGMPFLVAANGAELRGRTDLPDGQASEQRTVLLGTFAMPKGIVRVGLGGTKAKIVPPQKFHGLRLVPVGG